MIRFSVACLLLSVAGCADRAPTPAEVLENSRKNTAEIQQKVEEIKQSTEQAVRKGEELKQKPAGSADPKFH